MSFEYFCNVGACPCADLTSAGVESSVPNKFGNEVSQQAIPAVRSSHTPIKKAMHWTSSFDASGTPDESSDALTFREHGCIRSFRNLRVKVQFLPWI